MSETFTACTGAGRQDKGVRLPGYERSRTLLILMGVARLGEVVDAFLGTGLCAMVAVHKRGAAPSDWRQAYQWKRDTG